jgi:hypothetical protein
MTLLALVVGVLIVDILAYYFGVDSRDGLTR